MFPGYRADVPGNSMDENEELDLIRECTGQFGDDICKIQDVSPDISRSIVQNIFLDDRENTEWWEENKL